MTVLDPAEKLTPLDRRILRVLEDGRCRRAGAVIDALYPRVKRVAFDEDRHVRTYRDSPATADQQQEVREILSGMAHLGLIRRKRGGWWQGCSQSP